MKEVIGVCSPAMQAFFERAEDALAGSRRAHPPSILVTGDSGTGKTLLAHWLHANGPRARRPLFVVDGRDPETAFDSVLAAAHGATLLVDDVGAMPREPRAKLAAALARRKHDVAVLATDTFTERVGLGEEGSFVLRLPLLRNRGADLEELALHFMAVHGAVPSDAIMDLFIAHPWPRNVAELVSAIARIVAHPKARQYEIAMQVLGYHEPPRSGRFEVGLA